MVTQESAATWLCVYDRPREAVSPVSHLNYTPGGVSMAPARRRSYSEESIEVMQ